MTQYRFKWYLHDDDLWESFADHNPDLPSHIVEHIVDNNPFYEIEVEGFYDTETNKIVLDKVK